MLDKVIIYNAHTVIVVWNQRIKPLTVDHLYQLSVIYRCYRCTQLFVHGYVQYTSIL